MWGIEFKLAPLRRTYSARLQGDFHREGIVVLYAGCGAWVGGYG